MKSCRSCRVCGLERSVLFMCTQYTIWGAVPVLCATSPTGAKRLTSLCYLAGKCLHTASHSIRVNSSRSSGYCPSYVSVKNSSTIESMSSISCSRLINISSIGLGTKVLVLSFMLVLINLQTCHRITVENHALILHGVLDTNARDLPCVSLLPMVSIDQGRVTHHAVQLLALKKKNPVNMYTIHANGTNGVISGQFKNCHHTHWLLF